MSERDTNQTYEVRKRLPDISFLPKFPLRWKLAGLFSLSVGLAVLSGCGDSDSQKDELIPPATAPFGVLSDQPEGGYHISISGYNLVEINTATIFIAPDQINSLYQGLLKESDPEKRISSAFSNTIMIGESRGFVASGILLDSSGVVLTAAHTFLNKDTLQPTLEPAAMYAPFKASRSNPVAVGFKIKSVYLDVSRDLALLYAPTNQPAEPSPYLQLRDAPPSEGEALYILGWYKDNFITLRGEFDSTLSTELTKGLMTMDQVVAKGARPIGGMSGGPVVDKDGKVIGILSGGLGKPTRKDYKGASFTLVSQIKNLVNRNPFFLKD